MISVCVWMILCSKFSVWWVFHIKPWLLGLKCPNPLQTLDLKTRLVRLLCSQPTLDIFFNIAYFSLTIHPCGLHYLVGNWNLPILKMPSRWAECLFIPIQPDFFSGPKPSPFSGLEFVHRFPLSLKGFIEIKNPPSRASLKLYVKN